MSEYKYTAEDFEQAQFAIDPNVDNPFNRNWVRWDPKPLPWHGRCRSWLSDADMAKRGCIPIYPVAKFDQKTIRECLDNLYGIGIISDDTIIDWAHDLLLMLNTHEIGNTKN